MLSLFACFSSAASHIQIYIYMFATSDSFWLIPHAIIHIIYIDCSHQVKHLLCLPNMQLINANEWAITNKLSQIRHQGPTWQIKFGLDNVNQTKIYTLQIALATATVTALQVRKSRGTPWALGHIT